MPMTTWRWRMSLLGCCALVTALALRALRPADEMPDSVPGERAYFNRLAATTSAMRREGGAYVRERLAAVADSLDRVASAAGRRASPDSPASDAFTVEVIPLDAVGRSARAAVEAMARREVAALPSRRLPIRVLILESPRTVLPRPVARNGSDAPFARYVRLPRRPGEPCSLLLTARALDTVTLGTTLASSDGVLGPCAFVAAFGLPGAALRAHLDSAGWHPAAFARWTSAAADDEPPRWTWSDLTADGVRCLMRGDDACARGWRNTEDFDGWLARRDASALPGAVGDIAGPLPWYGVHGDAFGVRQRLMLADLAREIGPARFAEWWRSDVTVDEAYRHVVGMREGAWLSRWLGRSYRTYVPSPAPRREEIAWSALLIGVGISLLWQAGSRRAS